MNITTEDISDADLEKLFASLPSLDFRGRNIVEVREKAKRLRLSKYHVCRLLAEDKVAITQFGDKKSMIRTPLNEYRRWVLCRLVRGTGLPLHDEGSGEAKVTGLLSRLRSPLPLRPDGQAIAIPAGLMPAPGLDSLKVDDVSFLTGMSPSEVFNEIVSARLLAMDFSSAKARRVWMRIPRDLYTAYLADGLARGLEYKPCPRQGRNPDGHHPLQAVLIPDPELPPAA